MAYNSSSRTFDTISDLRLQRGSGSTRVGVLGYYSAGDHNGAEYYWDASCVDTDNGGSVIRPTVSGAAGGWRLNINEGIDVRQFGAKSDGITDNVAILQRMLDAVGSLGGGIIDFTSGNYLVTPTSIKPHCLIPQSNTIIRFSSTGSLTIGGNNLDFHSAIRIDGVSNISVISPIIIGDKATHIGTTGESGFCISITNSRNINVSDAVLSNAWGDGIYLGGGAGLECLDINLSSIFVTGCRRNGISIVSCKGANLTNIVSSLHGGVAGTGSGIDIEPNAGTVSDGINLTNIRCHDNQGSGLVTSGSNINGNNIICYNNSQRGLYIASILPHTFSNVFSYNNVDHGVYLSFCRQIILNNVVSYNNTAAAGIRIQNCTGDIQLTNAEVFGNTDGISISGSSNVRYSVNKAIARNNTGTGIVLGCPNGSMEGCFSFSNNLGILISGDGSTCVNSQVYQNNTNGIQLSANNCRIIGGNYIYSNGQLTDNTYANIIVSLTASFNFISGNTIKAGSLTNKPRYGILINSATNVSNIVYINDISSGGTTSNLQDSGTTTIKALDVPTLDQVLISGNTSTLAATILGLITTANGITSRVVNGGNWALFQTETGMSNWLLQRGTNDLVLNRRNATTGVSIDNPLRIYSGTGNIRAGISSADPGVRFFVEGVLGINGSTITRGSGDPNGVLTGNIGDAFIRSDGSSGTSWYLKVTNASNTNWQPITTSGSGVIVATAVLSSNIQTNSYMNTNYATAGIGDRYIFTNMTDATGNVAEVVKITSTTWYNSIGYVKNT
jgi:hypothetical protein